MGPTFEAAETGLDRRDGKAVEIELRRCKKSAVLSIIDHRVTCDENRLLRRTIREKTCVLSDTVNLRQVVSEICGFKDLASHAFKRFSRRDYDAVQTMGTTD